MNKNEKLQHTRVVLGVLSALAGVIGFALEQWWLTGVGFGFALSWFVMCVICVNRFIDDEVTRIAPRHREKK